MCYICSISKAVMLLSGVVWFIYYESGYVDTALIAAVIFVVFAYVAILCKYLWYVKIARYLDRRKISKVVTFSYSGMLTRLTGVVYTTLFLISAICG